jgi:hypothetical protein
MNGPSLKSIGHALAPARQAPSQEVSGTKVGAGLQRAAGHLTGSKTPAAALAQAAPKPLSGGPRAASPKAGSAAPSAAKNPVTAQAHQAQAQAPAAGAAHAGAPDALPDPTAKAMATMEQMEASQMKMQEYSMQSQVRAGAIAAMQQAVADLNKLAKESVKAQGEAGSKAN